MQVSSSNGAEIREIIKNEKRYEWGPLAKNVGQGTILEVIEAPFRVFNGNSDTEGVIVYEVTSIGNHGIANIKNVRGFIRIDILKILQL